jgi:hypothetical protein
MNSPVIAKAPWRPDEEEQLRIRAVAGEHPAVIGKALGRTEPAVRHRMDSPEIMAPSS